MQKNHVRHHAVNIIIALIWGYFSYKSFRSIPFKTFNWYAFSFFLGMFIRNTSITLMFLIRRPAKKASINWKEWIIAIFGTFIGYLYIPQNTYQIIPESFVLTTIIVRIVLVLLIIISVFSLGRSFGIVPANRGIKTKGSYAYIRHPLYSIYIFFDLANILLFFSWPNMLVFCTFILVTFLRVQYEEKFLSQDTHYQDYMKKTRYMFIPKIL